jgi:hypothetical protein
MRVCGVWHVRVCGVWHMRVCVRYLRAWCMCVLYACVMYACVCVCACAFFFLACLRVDTRVGTRDFACKRRIVVVRWMMAVCVGEGGGDGCHLLRNAHTSNYISLARQSS